MGLKNKKMDLDVFVDVLYAFTFESQLLTKKRIRLSNFDFQVVKGNISIDFCCVPKRGLSKVQRIKGYMIE